MFKKIQKKYPNLYSIIIAIALVSFWRGIWGLLELYLFPTYPLLSYLISILIGLSILYFNDFKLKELE